MEVTNLQMQLKISEWEDLIRITGGIPAPDKRVWYLVDYKWRRGKWKCTKLGQDKIMMDTNETREIVPL